MYDQKRNFIPVLLCCGDGGLRDDCLEGGIVTEKELRELDAWIAEHVMGLKLCHRIPAILQPDEYVLSIPSKIVRAKFSSNETKNFEPTTNPADAMAVLMKCAEKTESSNCIHVGLLEKEWIVGHTFSNIGVEAQTLELAICLFAKKLFS